MNFLNKITDKYAIAVGVLSALLNVFALVLLYRYSDFAFEKSNFVGTSIVITSIFLLGIYFRAFKRDMILGFFTLIKMGLIIVISHVLIYSISYGLYIKKNETTFKANYIEKYENYLILSSKYNGEHFEDPKHNETRQKMKETTIFDFILGDFIMKFTVGSFCSFIIAIILRNTKI